MHVRRGLLGWGVFFIVLGAVPLAVRSGLVSGSVVGGAWQLWPLVLIGVGIGLVLQRSKAAVVGALVVAVTAGLMAGGALAAGMRGFVSVDGFGPCSIGSGDGLPFPDQRGTLGRQAIVQLELDCGQLAVDSASGDGWQLTGSSSDGRPPAVDASTDRLSIGTGARSGVHVGLDSSTGTSWSATLPQAPQTQLGVTSNAGSAQLNLAAMTLTTVDLAVNAGSVVMDLSEVAAIDRLSIDVNAGSAAVILPAKPLTGDLTANAGSLEVCVPSGVDLRIVLMDNSLGSNNFADAGLEQSGESWATPGFGQGATRIELTASASLGSIDLNPESGCG
ncbi:MAG: hypothetical protein ABIR11_06440 [Candidatus Limnocylindrales bacterium]